MSARPAKRRRLDFDQICRWHGYIMVFYGISVFLSCVIEQTAALRWLTAWGFRLDLLYAEADGQNPAINAVYRVLSVCMFGIGLYEIKVPTLDQRIKEYYSKAFVMYCFPVGLCFAYDAIQPYAGPLALVTAAVPLSFGSAALYTLIRR
mmetsp:Transcript_23982/g.38585  ORF Transcript_23982/g.38585 Transcript_23982/m.38585 type:complete len:149 (+) Transcript_23982:309-755(+)